MNEGRLPSWVRLSSPATGSPRRVSQFEEHDRLLQRRHQVATRARPKQAPVSSFSDTAWKNPCVVSSTTTAAAAAASNRVTTAEADEYMMNHHASLQGHVHDNLLTIYCRQGLWEQALERCETHPHEAMPTTTTTAMATADFFQESWSAPFGQEKEKVPLYETTPLGILCSSSSRNLAMASSPSFLMIIPTLTALIAALASQGQVACSQNTTGNTPLKQAIYNVHCPAVVLATLLQQPAAVQALRQPDELGVYPLDYLLQRVRRLGNNSQKEQTALLQAFARHADHQAFENLSYSPLVRFYSTVTSQGVGMHTTWRHQLSVPTIPSFTRRKQQRVPYEEDSVVLISRILLQAFPGLLMVSSPTTGCLPIHAALRNYGNHTALLQVLLTTNTSSAPSSSSTSSLCTEQMMLHRNHFGDLPLHVACACGVPLPVLRAVLARTVQAATARCCSGGSIASITTTLNSTTTAAADICHIVWSTNYAGYTPIDLEWIRHIEAGNGFLSQAVFQPIGVEGIPRPRGRYNDLYDKLLRQAVDQVMVSESSSRNIQPQPDTAIARGDDDDSPLGLLLHRIFLIIRATFSDSFSTSPFDLSGDILHQASALFQPQGPSMPQAIMDLLLWQYPEQVEQRDHLGRTPVHHAVQIWSTGGGALEFSAAAAASDDASVTERRRVAWERWVLKLLSKSSRDVLVTVDDRGRYPLHAALDGKNVVVSNSASDGSSSPVVFAVEQYHTVVVSLAKGAPEAIQVRDPASQLFPALSAASHPLVPLDTVYWLLRRAPGVLGCYK